MLRKAILFSFSSSYLTILIEFISVLVVVRLLSPEEMGVFALSVSFLAILRVLRDFGVSQYIVQESELNNDRLRAAISITGFFGVFLALLIYFVAAPLSARFYESVAIEEVLQLLAFSFLLFPFGAIPLAYLRRELKFDARFKVEVCSAIAKAATAIICALNGFGYMSLAWASIAEAIMIVVVVAVVRPKDLPFMPGITEIGHVFYTSWRLAGGGFLQFIGGAAPALILGKVLGLHAVGLFDRGLATINIFNHVLLRSVNTLVLPYFSSSKRAGSSLKYEYLKANSIITGLAWPFFIFLAFNAEQVILLLYGKNWVSVSPIVVSLSIAQLLSFSCYLYEQFIVAQNRATSFLRFQGFVTPVRILFILIAAPYGLEAVANAFIAVASIRFIAVSYFLYKVDGITPIEFISSNRASLSIAFVTLVVCFSATFLSFAIVVSPVVFLMLEASMLALIWLAGIFVFEHPLALEVKRGIQYFKRNF